MSRSVAVLLAVVLVLVVALFVFAGRAHQQPQHPVEKAVSLGNLS